VEPCGSAREQGLSEGPFTARCSSSPSRSSAAVPFTRRYAWSADHGHALRQSASEQNGDHRSDIGRSTPSHVADAFRKRISPLFVAHPGWLTCTQHDSIRHGSRRPGGAAVVLPEQRYLDFAIDSTQVSISPDAGITSRSTSRGATRTVSGVRSRTRPLPPRRSKVITLKGDPFSREKLNQTTKRSPTPRQRGYAFPHKRRPADRRRTHGRLHAADRSAVAYVRRSTSRQHPDGASRCGVCECASSRARFTRIQIQLSRPRRPTSFFDDVNIETRPWPGAGPGRLQLPSRKSPPALCSSAGAVPLHSTGSRSENVFRLEKPRRSKSAGGFPDGG